MAESVFIGKIKKTHGINGHLLIELSEDVFFDEAQITFLLLAEKNADPIPFFFSSLTYQGDDLLVKLEDANSVPEAKKFLNRDVYLAKNQLPDDVEVENEFEDLIGYTVVDDEKGNIGTIGGVLEMPGQLIFTITHSGGNEILLPAIEEFITKIDDENKTMYYSAPAGLIDLYLEEKKVKEKKKFGK